MAKPDWNDPDTTIDSESARLVLPSTIEAQRQTVMKLERRTLIAGVLGTVYFAATGVCLAQGDRDPGKRVSPGEVTWENVDRYELQVRDDLPVGTPANKVVEYLDFWKLKHIVVDMDRTASRKLIHAVIDDLGRRGPFRASLSIYFELFDDKVETIRFKVEYL